MTEKQLITVGERTYELKYNERTIENIEAQTKKPLMAGFAQNNGMFALSHLRTYVSNALYTTEGARVSPQQGSDVFDAVLREKGYAFVNLLVVNAIQRDCPFFFQGV